MKHFACVLICISLILVLLCSCSLVTKGPDNEAPSENTSVGRNTAEAENSGENPPDTHDTPSENTGRAKISGSSAGGDLKYTTYDGKVITDFSFLDGKSRDFMPDSGDAENGSWYCGKTERNLDTGEVTLVWDRSPETLALLEKYHAVYRKNTDKAVCYITFDCGYENGKTAVILDILKEKNVSAAFFLNGHYIESAPDMVKRMLNEGHIVANHGNGHRNMSKLSTEEFLYEVESMNDLLEQYVPGAPYMEYYRPPYGTVTEWDLALIDAMGLKNILYSWTYYDFNEKEQPEPAAALEQAKKGLHNGCVYMFHSVSDTNTKILGDLIDYIRAEGFEIRSLDE